MIENNLPHKSGAKSTLFNVAMKGFPLSSHIFIRALTFCFPVTWCPSATSMYLSVCSHGPGMKSETSGVIWHVAPESKIQLVNCELSPYFSLERLSLLDMHAVDAYIFWSSLFLPLLHTRLPFLLKHTCFCRFSLSFAGLGHFEIMWSSDQHLKNFQGVRYICLLDVTSTAWDFYFSFFILLEHFSSEQFLPPQNMHFVWTVCALSLFLPEPELLSRFR